MPAPAAKNSRLVISLDLFMAFDLPGPRIFSVFLI
jgi:hypothetical protein